MNRLAIAAATVLACCLAVSPAAANIVVNIDKSSQQMSVSVDGATRYVWSVSTGRTGYGTPSGVFYPQRMYRSWFSKKYYNSPMPYSIFFHGGFAIHGSYEIRRLGGPASHGCVRLHPNNAATLYALVQQEGMSATRIVVSGSSPAARRARRAREPVEPHQQYQMPESDDAPFGGWFR